MKKLADWRTKHKEKLAKALLSEPTQTTIGRLIKPTGVVLIMGDRRSGKSVTAFSIMEYFHDKKGIKGAVCYPQMNKKLRRLLPKWVMVVTRVKDLPSNCTCIIDEASQVAHARRTSSTAALDMEALVALSEQKGQLILFISHHSRKFDIADVHGSNLIIWKQPTLADTMWERDELQTYVLRAWEFFQKLYPVKWNPTKPIPKKVLQACFVMNLRRMEFYTFRNGLPKFWSVGLSTVFKLFEDVELEKPKSKESKSKPSEPKSKKGAQKSEKRRGTSTGSQRGRRHTASH
jgi:hypothetical protein